MSYVERVELYGQIEGLRNRPLICFVTSLRQNAWGQMAQDVIPEVAKQLDCMPRDATEIDILVVSKGGDPTVSWRFISMLRERFERIEVLLPYEAYSAATLLALGANAIVMHPYSNLGPVDPQVQSVRPGQPGQQHEKVQFGPEDLRHFLDFVRTDVGISDQEQLQRAFELVCNDVGAIPIGVAKRSSYLSLSMSEKLLSLHMEDKNQAKTIAKELNTSFYHHGYPLGRKEAKHIGLPVEHPDQQLEALMWKVWQDIELEMECHHPFNPLDIVMADPDVSAVIGPVLQIQLPANLPPQLMQQAYKNILQQIQIVPIKPVDYTLFQGMLESTRCRSEFKTHGKINAVRKPDMTIAVNVIPISQKWTCYSDAVSTDEE